MNGHKHFFKQTEKWGNSSWILMSRQHRMRDWGSERTLKAFLSNKVPYMIGNVLLTLILTVLAPFKNRERTYTDSTCPISEPWAHLSWQCLPHFKTVSALILTVCAPFQKCERTYSDSACPILMMMKWCLMSLDVSWHIRDKFVTNAEGRFNIALRPRKPEGSLGRTAQDVHLDSHIAPELCCLANFPLLVLYTPVAMAI